MNKYIKKYILFMFLPLPPIEFDGKKWGPRLNIIQRFLLLLDFFNNSYKNNISKIFLFLKHLISLVYLFITLPFQTLIYFSKYRILDINFYQVGAFVQQLDCLIKSNELKKKKYRLILIAPKNLCVNNYIKNLYGNHIIILNNFFTFLFLHPFTYSNICSINPWKYEATNPNCDYNKLQKNYKKKFKNYLLPLIKQKSFVTDSFIVKNNIDIKKFVCVHIRDDEFYGISSSRSSSIENIKKSIFFLIKKKIKVVRFIHKKTKKLKIKNPYYLELVVESEKEKEIQCNLIQLAKLIICSAGGINSMNVLSKADFFCIDATQLNMMILTKSNDMFILKRYYDKVSNKIIPLHSIFSKNLHLYPEQKNFFLKNNTKKEIFDVVKNIIYDKSRVNCKNIFNNKKFIKYSIYHTDAKLGFNFRY